MTLRALITGIGGFALYRQAEVPFSGGSDHYVLSDPSVGVPTPMLIEWPDRFYHTSADTPEHIDPDSLARTAALAAAYAYWLATPGEQEVSSLGFQMVARFKERLVAAATNLVAGDTNAVRDVFVRDMATGVTIRVSVTTAGAQATGGDSGWPVITPDGRYVTFGSEATNLVSGDTNGATDIFTRLVDLQAVGVEISPKKMGSDQSWQAWITDPSGVRIEFLERSRQRGQLHARQGSRSRVPVVQR